MMIKSLNMKRVVFGFGLILLYCSLLETVSAQEYVIRPIGNAVELGMPIDVKTDPEDMGRIKGVVTDDKGVAIVDAIVTIYNDTFIFGARSKKGGNYSLGGNFGVYNLEVSSPGYAKYKAEVDFGKGEVKTVDVKLTSLDGKPVAGERGNDFTGKGMNYFMKIASKHPAYKGKTLLDVLADAPAVDMEGGELKVMDNSNVRVYVDDKPLPVPFDVMVRYFGSVAASDVKMVRVVAGAADTPSMLYITTAQYSV